MTKLIWDEVGTREYEIGADRGVFYPLDGPGTPWNGLVSVKEAPSGADGATAYFDGRKYQQHRSVEGFAGTIEAITYPDAFEAYSGMATGQGRRFFNFTYRTLIGNDIDGMNHGYKIHLVYNAMVAPAEKSYLSFTDSSEPTTFAWNFTTMPISIQGHLCSHLVIDTTKAHPWTIEALENLLYGEENVQAVMPDPFEVVELFDSTAILRVIDNGDGTWTATGPDEAIQMLDAETFAITWESAVYIDDKTYFISSL